MKSVADIYDLTEEHCTNLERMGKKSAENILREIENSKKLPLERVIYGLGIRFVASARRSSWPSTSAPWTR